ncbi:hypothetical protein [Nocardia fluminea]|uniref:hypothetical protein n=1 Tax=Nocardia fluminea TaxID=134984 RepID=UPI003665C63E
MTHPRPDADKLKAALTNFGKGIEALSVTLSVQNAMGAVWSNDLDRARAALRRIPAGKLNDVALHAMALASLAETITKEGTTE